MDKKVLNPGIMAFKFILRASFYDFLFVGLIGAFIGGFLMSVKLSNYEAFVLWILFFIENVLAISTLFKKNTMLKKNVPMFLIIVLLFEAIVVFLNNELIFKETISILKISGLLKILFFIYSPSVAYIIYKSFKMSVRDDSNNETITADNSMAMTSNNETITADNSMAMTSNNETITADNSMAMTSNNEIITTDNEPINPSEQMMSMDNSSFNSSATSFNQSINNTNTSSNDMIQDNSNIIVNNQENKNNDSDEITII